MKTPELRVQILVSSHVGQFRQDAISVGKSWEEDDDNRPIRWILMNDEIIQRQSRTATRNQSYDRHRCRIAESCVEL